MRIFLPVFAAFLFSASSAYAQTKPPTPPAGPEPIIGSAKAPMPQRESDFVAMMQNARRQYLAARSVDGRQYARMAMQSTVHNFMGLSHRADGWVGVFRDSKKNPLETMSVEIEVAPGVTVGTWDNPAADTSYYTLIRQSSAMGKLIDSLVIGDEVVFSGDIVGAIISSDEEMVLHPRFIARFEKLQKIDGSAPAK